MTARRAALFAMWCAALLAGALSCSEVSEFSVQGKRFTMRYWDMIGTVRLAAEVNDWSLQPGQDLDLAYTLDVEFSSLTKENVRRNVKGVWVVWAGERLFDENGECHQMVNALMSTYLTTTGLPIENNQAMLPSRKAGHFYGSPFDFADHFPFDGKVNVDHLHLTGHWRRPLVATVPPGLYRLTYDVFLDTTEMGTKQWAAAPFLGGNSPQLLTANTFSPKAFLHFTRSLYPKRFLPMIQIGQLKSPPRIPWVLFPKVHVNGNAGVVANEDKDRFAISSRYRFPNRLIMPPGVQQIYPCLLTNFPLAADFSDVGGAVLAQHEIEHYFDFKNGAVSVSVQRPDGEVKDLGARSFVGKREGGPLLANGDYE
jgi:hypothetical protein